MKKYVLLLVAVLFLGLPGGVRAEELTVEPFAVNEVVEVADVEVPDVESRWFGLRWAFERVSHNISLLITRSEDKKVELEIRFAEKEQKLLEKIDLLAEKNPKAAERLSKVAEKMGVRHVERLEKIERKMMEWQERGDRMEGRVEEKLEQMKERKDILREKLRMRRLNEPADGVEVDDLDEVETGGIDGQIEMTGEGVKIKGARPGVVRVR